MVLAVSSVLLILIKYYLVWFSINKFGTLLQYQGLARFPPDSLFYGFIENAVPHISLLVD